MFLFVTKYKRILSMACCIALVLCISPIGGVGAEEMDFSVDTQEEEISEYCNLDYEECASSKAGKLFVHYKSGRFYFQDTVGQKWYSNPDMGDMDEGASGVFRMELQSLLLVQYYDWEAKQYKKVNTETSCVRSSGKVEVTKIENGFEALYDFALLGFKIPLRVTIDENGVSATINCSEIVESEPEKRTIFCVSVLPFFGAGGPDEQGYIMIADGSGAIMNFNNGVYSKLGYSSHVYGRDISKYLVSRPADNYAIALPVFGIKKSNSAFCGIVTDGAAQSTFWCFPNKSITSYANVYAAFDLRESDIVVLSDSASKQSTLYQKGDISLKKIGISYRFVIKEDANYNGMAKSYKEHLSQRDGLKITQQSMGKTALDFYGGVKKKKSILGFPITVSAPLSKIKDIEKFVKKLGDDGQEGFSVTLRDWSKEQLSTKIDYSMKPISEIGNKKQINSLKETLDKFGGLLNLEVELNSFKKSGRGYFTWFHSAKSLSNAPIYDYEYFISNSAKNKSAGRWSYLVPSHIEKMAERVVKKNNSLYNDLGVSLGDMTTSLYSDFSKDNVYNLDETRIEIEKAAKAFGKSAVDYPADYAIKYTSLAQNVPTASSKSDIFDMDIPFVQLVLSGMVPYTTQAINLSADTKSAVLEAASTGSRLQFALITEDAYSIVGTSRDELYNSSADILYDDILKYSQHFAQLEKTIGDGYMTHYIVEGEISETIYSNGAVVRVDRSQSSAQATGANGEEYKFTL